MYICYIHVPTVLVLINLSVMKLLLLQDFGQKLHGTVTCTTCGMTYSRRHPDDELTHSRHHRDLFRALQFTVSKAFVHGMQQQSTRRHVNQCNQADDNIIVN
jgi:hypothetical protein